MGTVERYETQITSLESVTESSSEAAPVNEVQPVHGTSPGYKNCPYCAELIQDAAVVCRFCGRDLMVKTLYAPNKSKRLAEIHMQIANTELEISRVQTTIGETEQQIVAYKGEQSRYRWLALIGLLLAPVVIGIFFFIIALVGSYTANSNVSKATRRKEELLVELDNLRQNLAKLRSESASLGLAA